ncbi:hypothetical protein NPN23_23485, partial [Vibrio parahaemolyticus]|nr:hypothetical protein [Vibrio parahaemolyticus]
QHILTQGLPKSLLISRILREKQDHDPDISNTLKKEREIKEKRNTTDIKDDKKKGMRKIKQHKLKIKIKFNKIQIKTQIHCR